MTQFLRDTAWIWVPAGILFIMWGYQYLIRLKNARIAEVERANRELARALADAYCQLGVMHFNCWKNMQPTQRMARVGAKREG